MNAGKGSNKNYAGEIESDASIMQLDPPCLGAAGCITGLQNPIDAAKIEFHKAFQSKRMSRYYLYLYI